MSLSTMYAAVNNSPVTSLSAGAGASDTELTVADGSVLPAGPNLVTLGDSETAEVVCYQSRSGNVLSGCVRGIGGTSASVWPAGTTAARNFTAYDHDTFRTNILDLDTRMAALPVVPSGGTTGQVLKMTENGASWEDLERMSLSSSAPTEGVTALTVGKLYVVTQNAPASPVDVTMSYKFGTADMEEGVSVLEENVLYFVIGV